MINSFLIILFLFSSDVPDAGKIIDEAIRAHGGSLYENSTIEFDFRDRHYSAYRKGGLFRYERTFEDTSGHVRDVLTNNSVYREVNGAGVKLSDRKKSSIHSSVNSVIYFAILPYRLNDPAVRKKYLGSAVVRREPYHKIEITFVQEGGGKDYQERFVYWIHEERKTIGYLAYTFQDDGGGTRFRQAIETSVVNGIRFYDYSNFKSEEIDTNIEDYDRLIERGGLDKISEIILDSIKVTINTD